MASFEAPGRPQLLERPQTLREQLVAHAQPHLEGHDP